MKRSHFLLAAGLLILAAQNVASYYLSHESFLPSPPPLMIFPIRLDKWVQVHDWAIEPEVLKLLSPDDSLNREYQLAEPSVRAALFVAYYKTQLRAKNAHD